MMQTPVYSPSVPSYINTGALGTLLAEHLAAFTVTNNGKAIAKNGTVSTRGRILVFAYASYLLTYANLVFLSPCVRKPSYLR